jgi:hypothetical protein
MLERIRVNSTQKFSIRRSFLFPLGLLLVLAGVLFVVVLLRGEPKAKLFILGFIMLPVVILFVESAFRRTVLTADGVMAFKLLRNKEMKFVEVTAVETVQVRKRVFLTLCAGDDFLIISNAYANFPGLVQSLLARVPAAAISEETRQMAAAPPVKSTDVISCWLAVALLAFILYIQLGGLP